MEETLQTALVPTENASQYFKYIDNYKLWRGSDEKATSPNQVNQILLVLSNEEIKEGDLFLNSANQIKKCLVVHSGGNFNCTGGFTYYKSSCKKISASTDKELTPNSFIESIPDWWVEDYNKSGGCSGVQINDFREYKDTSEMLKFAGGKVSLLRPKVEVAEGVEGKLTQLDLADAQFIGFRHGVDNKSDITGLVTSMGLTKNEWDKWKNEFPTHTLTESEQNEINDYFNKH